MLITPLSKRDAITDRKLAVTLASIAGSINGAAFYAVGFFSANMTGNVSVLSDHIATGTLGTAWIYLAIIVAFISGAAACTLVVTTCENRGTKGPYAFIVFIEGLLLMPLVAVDLWTTGILHVALVVVWLAFLMGLQNAVATHVSDARVRTTHVSGMATDLGIELAMAWRLRGSSLPAATANLTRLRLHVATMLAFVIGGIVGVFLYRILGSVMFMAVALLLCGLGLKGILSARHSLSKQSE